jgi:hypothetical protein
MAYIKYKEITKYFYFSKALEVKKLPKYVSDYVFSDEIILAGYKTARDHGIFTDKKMVLFDNTGFKKEISTIPYKSISTCSVSFKFNKADLLLFLDSGYPMRLKFVNMDDVDKVRLRILYSCISKYINNQPLDKEDMRILIENDIKFK